MTLEAYSDTIVPGEKRSTRDQAIAGAAPGPGSVAASALDLLNIGATGVTSGLPYVAQSLNHHTKSYAGEVELELDHDIQPFLALPYENRRELVRRQPTSGHPETDGWVSLALF